MFEPAGRLSAKLFNLPNISCICTELLAVVGSLVGWWLVVVGFVFVTLLKRRPTMMPRSTLILFLLIVEGISERDAQRSWKKVWMTIC